MEAILTCLRRLAPHVVRDEVAITGSAAARLRPPADLDLVVARHGVVAASVCRDFLVSHHHDGDRLVFQLVDPVSRARVDIFIDRLGAIATARTADHGWRVVSPDVLLQHKLEILAKASAERPIDPKHAADAQALAAQLGRNMPPVDPSTLRAEVYSTDVAARCARCDAANDPAFPLAPKEQIFRLLGYV